MKNKKSRKVIPTILIVVEGYAEKYFVEYIKTIFYQRDCGFKVDVKNARGKGALHVVEYAKRLKQQLLYESVCVVFDTDKDWNSDAKKLVKDFNLKVTPSDPCLEAELLRIMSINPDFNTELIKKQFIKRFGCNANKVDIFDELFPVDLLKKSALNEGWLKSIVQVIVTGNP